MIAQRLASESAMAVRSCISLSFYLSFSVQWTVPLWRRSVREGEKNYQVTSLCVCVFVLALEDEDSMAPAGSQSRQEPVGRGQRYYHPALCALVTRWALISTVIGLFVCRWVMAHPAHSPKRQRVSRAHLPILLGAWQACPLLKRQHTSTWDGSSHSSWQYPEMTSTVGHPFQRH